MSSLAWRSGLSNCAGVKEGATRDDVKKQPTLWLRLNWVPHPPVNKTRRQRFDDSCKMLFSMLLACAEYEI